MPRILITAGPTHEPIDSVRYIANRSSGRMGIALAEAFIRRGWPTTLLLGPTALNPLESTQLRTVRFQSTADLQGLLAQEWPKHDVLIMAAAVADYRPKKVSGIEASTKLKRSDKPIMLELEPTPDLLAGLASNTRADQRVIGFALEPADRLIASANEKLGRKKLDAIVANPLETMDSPNVSATVIYREGSAATSPANLSKTAFAEWLLETLDPLFARN